MGHSDAFPLQDAAQADAAATPDGAVSVWGDTAHPALEAAGEPAAAAEGAAAPPADEVNDLYHRIGHLTRTLHDALHALGYQESLADARDNLPDARERLAYIARLTGDAAEKVLNSVDRARTVQEGMASRSQALRKRWETVATYTAKGGRATPAGARLVEETTQFLATLSDHTGETNTILTEIMMAQDFHDLTGQVIRRVVDLAQTLEEQLVKLLIDATPADVRKKVETQGLEGPVVNPEKREDVVADQAGVDDLLASLGF
jgi:chemotaxis protein CheZ